MASYKVVVVGGGGVGKSALTVQLIHAQFIEEYEPTIEDMYQKQVEIDNKICRMEIIDTAGQEEYSLMRDTYLRSGDGFMIVYAVNARESFDEVSKYRDYILKTKEVPSYPMVIIANKSDLVNERDVSVEEGTDLAKIFGCPFLETSAKNRINVEEAFFSLIREIRNFKGENPSQNSNRFGNVKKKSFKCFIL
ncbi:ras gtpase-related [Anaeramoeba ignava]|uniref:Ras gtpase-related n=1 Tax=Anaeramoeba ignava TaxID=1746090 RepID=A0A9Q0R9N7_ANAIG|nr:ras gtpase-related [Anaeramoeba ignava]